MLYDFNMGYTSPEKIKPHSPIAYHIKENEFYHPWSIESIGHNYGHARLKDIIPLGDYLTLPAHLVDGLLRGIMRGEKQREAERPKEPPPSSGNLSPEEKMLMDLVTKGKT